VDRLFDIVENGFWMNAPKEQLTGGNARASSGSISYKYFANMTCFTEIRLSQCHTHAKQYGQLGVGVDRKFVLDRWGSPVHYVRNRGDEHIVGAFFDLRVVLLNAKNKYVRFKNAMAKDSALKDVVDRHPLIKSYVLLDSRLEHAEKNANYIGTFFKAMSSIAGREDFKTLEEHEWRIVATQGQNDKWNIVYTGPTEPLFKLKIAPSDVRLIVLPDKKTRELAVQNPKMKLCFWKPNLHPPILTLADCSSL